MRPQDILVTGGTGFLGRRLQAQLPGARYLGSRDLDLRDGAAVAEAIAAWKPRVVVDLAAGEVRQAIAVVVLAVADLHVAREVGAVVVVAVGTRQAAVHVGVGLAAGRVEQAIAVVVDPVARLQVPRVAIGVVVVAIIAR